MPRLRAMAALLGLVCTAIALAKDSQSLSTFQSRSFQVKTDVDRAIAMPLAEHMDTMYASYRDLLPGFAPRNSQRSTLYVLSDQGTYLATLAELGLDARNTGGVFFWSAIDSGLATWVEDRSRFRLKEVLQHEGFHQFARTHIGDGLPIWANEGLAEYFGYAMLVRGRLEPRLVPSRPLQRVSDAISRGMYLPFDELLRMDGREWGDRVRSGDPRAAVAYDQSWSVVHFLLHAENRKYSRAFLKFLQLTSTGLDIEHSLQRAFGSTEFEPFESAWKRYIASLEADPLSEMVERLAFMAEGLLTLHRLGEEVGSIEELKAKLIAIGFEQRFGSHGGAFTMSAEDEQTFAVPAPEGRRKPITLALVPAKSEGLPPTIEVRGLSARVRTVWLRGPSGEWQSDVEIR